MKKYTYKLILIKLGTKIGLRWNVQHKCAKNEWVVSAPLILFLPPIKIIYITWQVSGKPNRVN
jgi:hypothetical protein